MIVPVPTALPRSNPPPETFDKKTWKVSFDSSAMSPNTGTETNFSSAVSPELADGLNTTVPVETLKSVPLPALVPPVASL
jgi:hypothetical protein